MAADPAPFSLRLATRSSPLALVQVELVAAALEAAADAGRLPRGAAVPVKVATEGDLRPEVPIASIGGRGVFVREVDEATRSGRADAAVHSAKDLPSRLEGDLHIAAYLPRDDPRDALVGLGLEELAPGALVATGSVRRRAQLAWMRPDLRFGELRGNIATRLGKVPGGGALVVALAALRRLGLAERAATVLSPSKMLPQAGQGAIAVACRAGDEETRAVLGEIDHAPTRLEVEAERAFLRQVGGGCDAPVGALARCMPQGGVRLEAMIASPDGHVLVRDSAAGTDPEALGATLAERLLRGCGGRELLGQAPLGP